MGCGGCGGGHDPYASYRNKGVRMSRGTSVGVTKSEKRLARESQGQELKVSKKSAAIKKIAEKNKELSADIPASGIIKSKNRLAREKKEASQSE